LTSLLWDKKISLLYDESQWFYDKYNRLLAYVILSGININETIIEHWYGFEYTYDKPYKFQKEFKLAENQAKINQKWLRNDKTCNGERIKE
jgi:micrococcal nuclease